jgi:hypothetical protein
LTVQCVLSGLVRSWLHFAEEGTETWGLLVTQLTVSLTTNPRLLTAEQHCLLLSLENHHMPADQPLGMILVIPFHSPFGSTHYVICFMDLWQQSTLLSTCHCKDLHQVPQVF